MALRIEDYALIGDTHTAALVGRDGSVDWLCLPRFDSPACFAALLGTPDNGRWLLAPAGASRRVTRHYRGETLILETEFETEDGVVRLIDFMPPRDGHCSVVRVVEGVSGNVAMHMELVIRFDYGHQAPWLRRMPDGSHRAVAGPDSLTLRTPVETEGRGLTTVADFTVAAGHDVPFVLTWSESHLPPPPPIEAEAMLVDTDRYWTDWAATYHGSDEHRDPVVRSLITLKALTYAPTGGIVAAPTTSLPEFVGGVRNWDYRYCWLRDATFTLYALHLGGYREEAAAWRDWLLRAAAGNPADMQIMYGPAGERRLTEYEVPWLGGYEGSQPVRVGNAASQQFQLDVYGEVTDAIHLTRRAGIVGTVEDHDAWAFQQVMLEFLESAWTKPDEGIWEVRGPRRHFTHSKMMAWVAVDRAVKDAHTCNLPGPVDRWRALRDEIHDEVCAQGFNTDRNAFVQFYGSDRLDASLLMMPLVGFLKADDPRVRGTVAAIERELLHDGFVARYERDDATEVDGLPPGEGCFLPCTFWLADNYALVGRRDEAHEAFDRLLALRNDVGLLSEEYDPTTKRLVGNFPQAFSHVGLINTAFNLGEAQGPNDDRL